MTVIPKKGIIGAGHFALKDTAAQVTAPSLSQWLACLNPNHALHRRIILGAGGVDDLDTYDVLWFQFVEFRRVAHQAIIDVNEGFSLAEHLNTAIFAQDTGNISQYVLSSSQLTQNRTLDSGK